MFFAAKEDDRSSWIEIMRRPTMLEWAQARFEGFNVVTGSPADKIMQRLVREGGAVVLKPNETYHKPREKKRPYH
jgi:hypothetical protein